MTTTPKADIKHTAIPDAVLDRLAELGPDEARVLLAIAVCAQRAYDHQWAVPLERIAAQAGLAAARVLPTLGELSDARYIRRLHPAGRDLWQVDLVNVAKVADEPEEVAA